MSFRNTLLLYKNLHYLQWTLAYSHFFYSRLSINWAYSKSPVKMKPFQNTYCGSNKLNNTEFYKFCNFIFHPWLAKENRVNFLLNRELERSPCFASLNRIYTRRFYQPTQNLRNFKQNPSKNRAKICKQFTDFSKSEKSLHWGDFSLEFAWRV